MGKETIEARDVKPEATPLEAWLGRATHGLCAQAKERVRREIAAHHAEAVEHLRETGLSSDIAHEQAIKDLGDEATANKGLRRTYLTTWQKRLLAALAQPVEPLEKKDYELIVSGASLMAAYAFIQVFLDCGEPSSRYLGYKIVFLFFVIFAGLYVLFNGIRATRNFLRRRNSQCLLPEIPSAMNRLYPWLLMACLLWLYTIWRIQYQTAHYDNAGADYIAWVWLLVKLPPRIHRRVGTFCFDASQSRTWARTGATRLYIAFLALVSVACLCVPYSWALMQDFVRFFSGTPMEFVYFQEHKRGSLFGEIAIISVGGIIVAVVLGVVVIRWLIGLYLLRKEVSGNRTAEPGPAPYPKTPLDE